MNPAISRVLLSVSTSALCLLVHARAYAESRGYLTTPEELSIIKLKAAQGIEPYRGGVAEVLSWASQSWNFALNGVASCSGSHDPLWNDCGGGTPILYAKALAYHLTGDAKYAQEVKNILERIMSEVKRISINELQCQLNFAWGTPELVASADLIEGYWKDQTCIGPTSTVYGHDATGSGNCKARFQNWLVKNPYYVVSEATTRMLGNNWGAAATNAAMYIADYMWDRPTAQLVHRNPVQVNGGNDYVFTPGQAYAFLKNLTIQRMNMQGVTWTRRSCDNLAGPNQSPKWPPVKSGITENGIVSEDAQRKEHCNIPRYDGMYENYPQLHLGNLIQQCELMLRRGDHSCYDNVEMTDIPSYSFVGPDGETRITHLYPGRGSLERAIDAIIVDAQTEWRRPGALRVAYRYYFNNRRLPGTVLGKWASNLGGGAGRCLQDICFGTLTHGFAFGENPALPPSVSPPQEKKTELH